MDRSPGTTSSIAEEILETDDLYHRTGGIASWTQFATYIIQPTCPGIPAVNQVRQVDLSGGTAPEDLLVEAREMFREMGLPNLEIRVDQRTQPATLGDYLVDRGFHAESDGIYFTATPAEVIQKPVHVLSAREMGVVEDLEKVLARWDSSCLDEELGRQAHEVRQFRRDAGILEEFVGYWEGEPACTFATTRSGTVGRIKDFYVDPDYLGEDFEHAVLSLCIRHLFDQGVHGVGLAGEDLSGLNYLLEAYAFTRIAETWRYSIKL